MRARAREARRGAIGALQAPAVGAVVLALALVPRVLDDITADDPQSGYFGPAVYLADVIADQPGNGPYLLDEGTP